MRKKIRGLYFKSGISVIQAIQEAEEGGLKIQGQPQQIKRNPVSK